MTMEYNYGSGVMHACDISDDFENDTLHCFKDGRAYYCTTGEQCKNRSDKNIKYANFCANGVIAFDALQQRGGKFPEVADRARPLHIAAYQSIHGLGERTLHPVWWYLISTAAVDEVVRGELIKNEHRIRIPEYISMQKYIMRTDLNIDWLFMLWYFCYGLEAAEYITNMYDIDFARGRQTALKIIDGGKI